MTSKRTYKEFEKETRKQNYKSAIGIWSLVAAAGISILYCVIHLALVVSFASTYARHLTYLDVIMDVGDGIGVVFLLVFLIVFITIIGFVNLAAAFERDLWQLDTGSSND